MLIGLCKGVAITIGCYDFVFVIVRRPTKKELDQVESENLDAQINNGNFGHA